MSARPSTRVQLASVKLMHRGCVCGALVAALLVTACSGTQTTAGTGDGPAGTSTIEPLTEGDPDVAQARGLIEQQKHAEAIPLLERALAKDPKDAEVEGMLGLAYDATGKFPEAEKHYKAALALDPKLSRVLQNLGALYISMDPPKAKEAVDLLRRAYEAEPNNVDAIRNLALAYSMLEEFDKSAKAYDAALKLSDDGAIHYEYGTMLLVAKKIPEGVAELKIAAAKTDDPVVLASIANTFGIAKSFDLCVSTLDKVIAKKPEAKLLMGRGQCKHELKQEKEANADFQEAAKLDPKSAQAQFYLGMSLIELKKTDEAKAALQKVCELDAESKACDNAKKVRKKNGW